MNKYCADLTFNFPCIKKSFDFTKYKGIPHSSLTVDIFENEFIKLVDNMGLKITWVEIFHATPKESRVYAVHTDNTGGDYVKINWVAGGKGSLMQWYDVNPGIIKEPIKTNINSFYVSYTPDEVKCVHSQSIKFPSIVQVGIPHNIYNPDEDRFCVSIMLRKKTDNNRLTMNNAVNLFSNFIVSCQ
jgi:hypothetical protein